MLYKKNETGSTKVALRCFNNLKTEQLIIYTNLLQNTKLFWVRVSWKKSTHMLSWAKTKPTKYKKEQILQIKSLT